MAFRLSIEPVDNGLRHWKCLPIPTYHHACCIQSVEFMPSLDITTGPKCNGTLRPSSKTIPRMPLLRNLTVLAKRNGAKLVVHHLAGHDLLGAELGRDSPLNWKKVELLGHKQHSVDEHNRRKCIEWEAVDHRPNLSLDDPNLALDFWHMLVSTAQMRYKTPAESPSAPPLHPA